MSASGADKCFGRIVTAGDFKDCPGITTPRIAVFKHCPTNLVSPGDLAVFSGTVTNAGNITLTNVIVLNNRPTNNTPVLGPISLTPGEAVNFTGSEVVPANCCTYFDTLTATGTSKCTGSNVTATATAVCPTITTARLVVTKNCPPAPVPLGHTLVFSGTVSNAGNITLTNVTVVNNQPSNNTPVFGPLTLAPGQLAVFTGSYLVPLDICDTNIADTLTARGNNNCTGSNVTATVSAYCPIVAVPGLTVTKQCPNHPVAPGDLFVYSGFVSNSGNITITNVFVVNDRPAMDTPVIGPITNLAPGQAVSFNGSYLAPYDCCGPCVDTLTARGHEICTGSNVTATASAACPRVTTPAITVTRDCPPPSSALGDVVFLFGSVSNSGNATLGGVLVADDQAGIVLDNLALAPGEAVPYFGMYILTNCGPALASGVTATGNDICSGNAVSNRFVSSCAVVCPNVPSVTLLNPGVDGASFLFFFLTEPNRTYTVEFTDSLSPVLWQSLTNFPGNGAMATILDSRTNTQRFYRVQVQ